MRWGILVGVGALAIWATRCNADDLNAFLDFNDNQIPAGWSIDFLPGSPGRNAQIVNNRFEVGQVDTYAELGQNVSLPTNVSDLKISYTANVADVYWGMGNQIHLYGPGGNLSNFLNFASFSLGKTGYGTEQMNLGIGYQVSSGNYIPAVTQTYNTPDYGTYNVNADFQNQQISVTVTKQGSSTPLYQGTASVPQFQLNQVSRIGLMGITTTGESAWIDNVAINSGSLTKYKQFLDPYRTAYIIPTYTGSESTFASGGCTLTAMATIATLFGADATPFQIRDAAKQEGLVDSKANTTVTGFSYSAANGITVRAGNRGHDFNALVSDLQGGDAALLAMPWESTAAGSYPLHYIAAYALSPKAMATPSSATPADIYISDPGDGVSWYGGIPGYSVTNEPTITLQNYFDALNTWEKANGHARVFDAQNWFSTGSFTDSGVPQTIAQEALNKLITEFTAKSAHASIVVHSPVELVLTDQKTGQRYVSSQTIAGPGDTVLTRFSEDMVTPIVDDSQVTDAGPLPAFSPYSLELPDAIQPDNLAVQIIGVDSGDYSVNYLPGSSSFLASAPLTGTIEDGQTVTGEFTITALPEPGVGALFLLGSLSFLRMRPRR